MFRVLKIFFLSAAFVSFPQLLPAQSNDISIDPLKLEQEVLLKEMMNHKQRLAGVHQVLGWTTTGTLLAGGILGAVDLFSKQKRAHDYRDSISYTGSAADQALQAQWIRDDWRSSGSQAFRITHSSLIFSSLVLYTITAAIEGAVYHRKSSRYRFTRSRIHRGMFITHAVLMGINVAAGFMTSYFLSQGKHEAVIGTGITHMVIGFTVPVLMFGSGLVLTMGRK